MFVSNIIERETFTVGWIIIRIVTCQGRCCVRVMEVQLCNSNKYRLLVCCNVEEGTVTLVTFKSQF